MPHVKTRHDLWRFRICRSVYRTTYGAQGWRVRVAVRRPNEAMFVKPYGVVGQVEPVLCNIRDDAACARLCRGGRGCELRWHSGSNGRNTFSTQFKTKARNALRGLRPSKALHAWSIFRRLGQMRRATSDYARTKARGEDGVLAALPNAVILRPSIVFGPEDEFLQPLRAMARMAPVIPLFGADTTFQPVYVDDVAKRPNGGDGAGGTWRL